MARRILIVVALSALGLVLASSSAGAHAVLQSSTPAAGSSLAAAPPNVTLRFTEPPDLSLSSVQILNATGRNVASGALRSVAGNGVHVALGKVPTGAYTVSWRVVSKVDGHLTAGAFGFGIGAPAPSPQSSGEEAGVSPTPSVQAVAARWMLAAGLSMLLGAAVAFLCTTRRVDPSWSWTLPAVWLTAWAGLGLLVWSEASRADVAVGALLSSERGGALVRVGVGLLVTVVAVVAAARRPSRGTLAVVGTAAAATMLLEALAGHAGAERSTTVIHVPAQWAHMAGVGAWIGGLPWLLRALSSPGASDAVQRFARMAAFAIVVVFATGIVRSLAEVGSAGRLATTSFGRTVLIKLVLFGVVAAIGARNHFRLVPRIAQGSPVATLRKAISAELLIAAGLFGAAGLLTELPPPVSVAEKPKAAGPVVVVASGADFATTTRARLTLGPGRPGVNDLSVAVADYDTGTPVEAKTVSVRVSLPSRRDIPAVTVPLARRGERWVAQTAALAVEGRWRFSIQVLPAQGRATEVTVNIPVLLPLLDVTTSEAPGQPTLYTASLANVGTVQVYADPQAPGPVGVHVTVFDPSGAEMPLTDVAIAVSTSGGQPIPISLIKVSPGHYTANATLVAGVFRVALDAQGPGKLPVSARIAFTIEKESS